MNAAQCATTQEPQRPPPSTRGGRRRFACAGVVLTTLLLGLGLPVRSQAQLGNVKLSGFGGWAYGITDGNRYLIGDEEGKYDNVQLSLNLTAEPTRRVNIVTQVDFEQREDDVKVLLDFAFVEVNMTDSFRLRLGRVKHPFGIYAEIVNVGTLRPFFLLPQSIYGPQGITARSYDGIGFRGETHGESWGFAYDIYAGEIQGEVRLPGPISNNPADAQKPEVISPFEVSDVIGARFNLLTPAPGLTLGISAYTGDQIIESTTSIEESYDVGAAHVEFLNDDWSIRSEIARFELGDTFAADGFYVEAAYYLDSHWQVAARWDRWDGDFSNLPIGFLPPFAPQFFDNKDLGLALNYWWSPAVVFRLNAHLVEGNRFAFPSDPQEILRTFITGQLEEDTLLVVLASQFSF